MFGEEDWDADMSSSAPTTSNMTFGSNRNEEYSSEPAVDSYKPLSIGRGRGKTSSFDSSYNSYKPRNNYGNNRDSNGGYGSNQNRNNRSFGSGEDGDNGGYRGNNSNSGGGYGDSNFSSGGGYNGSSSPRYGGGYEKKSYQNDQGNDSRSGGGYKGGFGKKSYDNDRGYNSKPRSNNFRGRGKSNSYGGRGGGYKANDDYRSSGFSNGHSTDNYNGGGFKNRGGSEEQDNFQFSGNDSGGFGGGNSYKQNSYKSSDNDNYGGRGGFKSAGNDNGDYGSGDGYKQNSYKSSDSGNYGGRGGFKSSDETRNSNCFKCDEPGRRGRDCPHFKNKGGKNGDYGSRGGYKSSGFNNSGETRSSNRFKSDQPEHIARNRPNSDSKGNDAPKKENYIPPPPPEDENEMFESLQRGINFSKYDSIPVEVSGENPPQPIASFQEANFTETIAKNVARAKYDKPTPVQKYSMPIISAGRDLMACAQTGSGKTAAFLLPVLTNMIRNGIQSSSFDKQTPQAIVVGPTRELVNQIYLEARKFARGSICRPCVAYGGTSVSHQMNDINRGCNILIATPGRLMDFINNGRIGLDHVQFVILDEADRMLDMGFEGEIRKLVSASGMPSKSDRQTLMFSATFPDEIQKLAHDFLKEDYIFLTVGRVGGACSDVTQNIMQIDQSDKREKLHELLSDVSETRARTLVFVETKRSADFLACSLSQSGYPTTSIHGDRLQREREEALRDFKKGDCPILIATSVAARGLDIPKVEHVINYDLPKDIDEYVHRIGRTGRCGNLGRATSFYDQSKDSEIARCLVRILADSMQEVPSWLEGCADSAIDSNFNSDRGSRFGSRDTRTRGRGRGGGFGSTRHQVSTGRSTGDYDYNDGGGFDSAPAAPTHDNGNGGNGFGAGFGEEESWD